MSRPALRVLGAGPPVVLLHPVGLDHTWWASYQAALAQRYQVIAVDLPGHGGAGTIRRPVTLDDLAATTAATVAAVVAARTDEPVHVVGASLGGMIAQHMALRAPASVASLILCATAGGFAEHTRPALRDRGYTALRDGMDAVIAATLDRWFSPEGRDGEIGRRCAGALLANDPASWAACWAAIAELDTLPRLAEVSVPALVITGAADTGTPPTAAAALAAALPAARLEIVPNAWHLGVFEDEPPFLAAFARFLDEVATRPAPASLYWGPAHG